MDGGVPDSYALPAGSKNILNQLANVYNYCRKQTCQLNDTWRRQTTTTTDQITIDRRKVIYAAKDHWLVVWFGCKFLQIGSRERASHFQIFNACRDNDGPYKGNSEEEKEIWWFGQWTVFPGLIGGLYPRGISDSENMTQIVVVVSKRSEN